MHTYQYIEHTYYNKWNIINILLGHAPDGELKSDSQKLNNIKKKKEILLKNRNRYTE